MLLAPIIHPSLYFYPFAMDSVVESVFLVLGIESSHVTCLGQWTFAVVIQEEAWKNFSHIPLMLLCLAITVSHPTYPSKGHPRSAFSQQITQTCE